MRREAREREASRWREVRGKVSYEALREACAACAAYIKEGRRA